jgi:putative ABC transport system permease protein
MKHAISKDTMREIRRTLSRFLSIFFIVAIGVSFFAGVKATDPDMKITADKYFDDYRLMDIRLLFLQVSCKSFNTDFPVL